MSGVSTSPASEYDSEAGVSSRYFESKASKPTPALIANEG
jgi:hypothetical protein